MLLVAAALVVATVPALSARALHLVRPRADVGARLAGFGERARDRMRDGFVRAGAAYPPREAVIAVFKRERRLEVYAPDASGIMRCVLERPVLGASGTIGPKVREGDMQVPEGEYPVASLNPNSLYHVALRVGYPSEEDRAAARAEGRDRLGGDIMIHGGSGSVGCIAMGDAAAEELFTLAADTGVAGVSLLLCPVDWRSADAPNVTPPGPEWLVRRYEGLRVRLGRLVKP